LNFDEVSTAYKGQGDKADSNLRFTQAARKNEGRKIPRFLDYNEDLISTNISQITSVFPQPKEPNSLQILTSDTVQDEFDSEFSKVNN
jgi:hypothetical protein